MQFPTVGGKYKYINYIFDNYFPYPLPFFRKIKIRPSNCAIVLFDTEQMTFEIYIVCRWVSGFVFGPIDIGYRWKVDKKTLYIFLKIIQRT